jgi:hypothetical protein
MFEDVADLARGPHARMVPRSYAERGAVFRRTIGTGIVAAEAVDAAVTFGALMGAICWNLITWWLGLPSTPGGRRSGGAARKVGAVRWNIATKLVTAWFDHAGGSTRRGRVLSGVHIVALTCGRRPPNSQSLLVLLESFDDRKRDPGCDRVWTRIPRTIAHAKADRHDAIDFLSCFSAEVLIDRPPRPCGRYRRLHSAILVESRQGRSHIPRS